MQYRQVVNLNRILLGLYVFPLCIVAAVVTVLMTIDVHTFRAVHIIGTVYAIINIIGLLSYGIHISLVLTAGPTRETTPRLLRMLQFKVSERVFFNISSL